MEETEIAGRLSAVEQRSKSNSHRLDALEKHTEALNTLATSVAVMAEKVEVTGEKVDGLCTDVQELKSEPGKPVEICGGKGHLHRRGRCRRVYSCPAWAGLIFKEENKMINWVVRIKNKNFWLAAIPALLLLVQTVAALFGFTLDLGEIGDKLLAVVNAVFALLVILGVVNDPTTAGIADSKQARTYSSPKED